MAEQHARGDAESARILDDPSLYRELDPTGLRHRLRTFPNQCREAWEKARACKLPRAYSKIDRVVVAGMGGSAIGGNLLADLASLEDSLPISVCREYDLPRFVNENTLVLACSYSGETEETLSVFRGALAKGAKIIAVTSGGILGAEAKEHNLPVLTVDYQGEPRSALGYSFIVPTVLLMNLGLISDKSRDFEEGSKVLTECAPLLAEDSPLQQNTAKKAAAQLVGRLIVIYGAGIFGGVARRWKTQFNENSKACAFFELLPEVHHNSVIGYSLPTEVKRRSSFILLQPATLHPRTRRRYRVTRELLDNESIPYMTVEGRGDSPLSQMLSAILLGDYISYYLALLEGVDPSPVPTIDLIKSKLSDAT